MKSGEAQNMRRSWPVSSELLSELGWQSGGKGNCPMRKAFILWLLGVPFTLLVILWFLGVFG